MEILSMLPMLLKVLPFAAIGVLYLLFRWEKNRRKKAESEARGWEESFKLNETVEGIHEADREMEKRIDRMDDMEFLDRRVRGLRPDSND